MPWSLRAVMARLAVFGREKMRNRSLCLSFVLSLATLLVTYLVAPERRLLRLLRTTRIPLERRRPSVFVGGTTVKRVSQWVELRFLLGQALPSLRSREGWLMVNISLLLVLRTFLSIRMSQLVGDLGKRIVKGQKAAFVASLASFFLWNIPMNLASNTAEYYTQMLQVYLRENLSRNYYASYMSQRLFFKIAKLYGDDTLDQRLTEDISEWSRCASSIFPNLLKPLVDIVLFSRRVAEVGGYRVPALVIGYYVTYASVFYAFFPRFDAFNTVRQTLEGRFRAAHVRILEYGEEITLSQGQAFELKKLNGLFDKANDHNAAVAFGKSCQSVMDGLLIKYGSVLLGYAVCILVVFSKKSQHLGADEIASLVLRTTFIFVGLANAVGTMLMNVKSIMELKSFSHRVCGLEVARQWAEEVCNIEAAQRSRGDEGVMLLGNLIRFNDVPIVSPDGIVLCESLNFYVKPGMNLLVVGPNGCGKSSMFRLLGELWPLAGGSITKPSFRQLYYVPQRPYVTRRTLRDQIIYPQTSKDVQVSESELYRCLELAGLEGILSRPNLTWDTYLSVDDDMLSEGEKQKLAMARLFFHKPRFAILDECSSAIDVVAEASIYQTCYELGISLITIAHRSSVWHHHNWILKFDGSGGYMFSPLQLDDNGEIILTKVECSSDPQVIGKEVRVSPMSPSYPRGEVDFASDSASTSTVGSRIVSPMINVPKMYMESMIPSIPPIYAHIHAANSEDRHVHSHVREEPCAPAPSTEEQDVTGVRGGTQSPQIWKENVSPHTTVGQVHRKQMKAPPLMEELREREGSADALHNADGDIAAAKTPAMTVEGPTEGIQVGAMNVVPTDTSSAEPPVCTVAALPAGAEQPVAVQQPADAELPGELDMPTEVIEPLAAGEQCANSHSYGSTEVGPANGHAAPDCQEHTEPPAAPPPAVSAATMNPIKGGNRKRRQGRR